MLVTILSICVLFSTLAGGLTALKNKDHLHHFLGYIAGVLLGVVAFDLLPEIFRSLQATHVGSTTPMVAFVVGFLLFHIIEKSILIYHSQEHDYQVHHHWDVGVASALVLSGHSFSDGVGIGLGFQAGRGVGIAVALAVIAHDFTDGLNTVNLMLLNRTITTGVGAAVYRCCCAGNRSAHDAPFPRFRRWTSSLPWLLCWLSAIHWRQRDLT